MCQPERNGNYIRQARPGRPQLHTSLYIGSPRVCHDNRYKYIRVAMTTVEHREYKPKRLHRGWATASTHERPRSHTGTARKREDLGLDQPAIRFLSAVSHSLSCESLLLRKVRRKRRSFSSELLQRHGCGGWVKGDGRRWEAKPSHRTHIARCMCDVTGVKVALHIGDFLW